MNYLRTYATKETTVNEPLLGKNQVENNTGGYVFAIDDWTRLNRFLVLGSDKNYYSSAQELTHENAEAVIRCLKADGPRTVSIICEVSKEGRAPKNSPALFALALAASHGDESTRRAALRALPEVARTGTHLFEIVTYLDSLRGWGRGLRNAISRYYDEMPADKLAYQVIKYRSRGGEAGRWTHDDVLRLAHPKAQDELHQVIYNWVTQRDEGKLAREYFAKGLGEDHPLRPIEAFERAQQAATSKDTVALIREYGTKLPREALNNEHLTDPEVWNAMLEAGMPMTAMLRNLANMTRYGLLTSSSEATKLVINQLSNREALRRARIHPINVLAALMTYKAGKSARGTNTWTPVTKLVDLLDQVFYDSFEDIDLTIPGVDRAARIMVALDVSGSMTGPFYNYDYSGGYSRSYELKWLMDVPGLDPRTASAAMAMVYMRAGSDYEVKGFSHTLMHLDLSPRQRLDDVVKTVSNLPFGYTDASLPLKWMLDNNRDFDAVVVFTDNEVNAGGHPSELVEKATQKFGHPVRLVVNAMTASNFSIADPNNPYMLDAAGLDSSTPQLIEGFIKGGF